MTIQRRTMLALVAALVVAVPPVFANSVDKDALHDRLFERLAAASTEEEGRQAEDAIWRMWVDHSDQPVREALALGMRQRDSYEWEKALQSFSRVILADRDYAEGWNQRAFIYFLKEDLDAALADLDKALELEPRHFGALTGKADVVAALKPGTHASTFGGNPLACAAALAAFETIREGDLIERARTLGEKLGARLEGFRDTFPFAKEVRRLGLMAALELDRPGAEIVKRCLAKGLHVNCTHDTVLRVVPAANCPEEIMEEGLGILESVLAEEK